MLGPGRVHRDLHDTHPGVCELPHEPLGLGDRAHENDQPLGQDPVDGIHAVKLDLGRDTIG